MDEKRVNPNEAPEGFIAVLKAAHKPRDGSNICYACDWRPTCNDRATNLLAYGHRCMSTPVVSREDGKTYQRQDGCSVLFKKKPES